MKRFYDYRERLWTDPKKYPLDGYVILKYKKYWLCWIKKTDLGNSNLHGFIVVPKSIYLYNVYKAKNLLDGIIALIRLSRND